jgi:hypothetical protein
VASAALRAQNILICTPRTVAARRRDAGQIGGSRAGRTTKHPLRRANSRRGSWAVGCEGEGGWPMTAVGLGGYSRSR